MTRYASIVVGVLVAAVCVRLGVWQLERLAQRRAANAVLEDRLDSPVLPLNTATIWAEPSATESLRYRRAAGTGTFDFNHEIIVMARVHRGVPGVHVVTPLVIGEGVAILVERGWVPAPDGKHPAIDPAEVADDSVLVSGVLMPSSDRSVEQTQEPGWPRYATGLDPRGVSAEYPYAVVPLALRRTELPPSAPTEMRAVALPPITDGPHLSYAVQWFSFAIIALVGSFIVYRRQGGDTGDVTAS